jgi:hypothetical protein
MNLGKIHIQLAHTRTHTHTLSSITWKLLCSTITITRHAFLLAIWSTIYSFNVHTHTRTATHHLPYTHGHMHDLHEQTVFLFLLVACESAEMWQYYVTNQFNVIYIYIYTLRTPLPHTHTYYYII